MSLITKSILEEKLASDGKRISVMSRHTLNDGITPHPLITEDSYDEWRKELAPPDSLVGAYYRKKISWEEFEKAYTAYIRTPEVSNHVKKLAYEAINDEITILCVESLNEPCHRKILAKECKLYRDDLYIINE